MRCGNSGIRSLLDLALVFRQPNADPYKRHPGGLPAPRVWFSLPLVLFWPIWTGSEPFLEALDNLLIYNF